MVGVVLLILLFLQLVAWLTMVRFLIGVVFLWVGSPLFLVGVELSVEKTGRPPTRRSLQISDDHLYLRRRGIH